MMNVPHNGEAAAPAPPPFVQNLQRQFQALLDKSTPLITQRWGAWGVMLLIYLLRVYLVEGFYIVTYAMAIYNLNLLLGFLTPLHVDAVKDEPTLPSKADEEFRPFVRRLPEFKFWYASSRCLCMGFAATFFPGLDVPVFWPILLLYWLVLFSVTMKRQIQHMVKYRYIPFSFGKKSYAGSGKRPAKNSN